ncbi:MAG: hypothetical protein JSW28_05575 [Thermoplasmata archaeon]|nr:MAG: hypothetical protein JSW28_05575 [Thermoplasmata archaeon]
MTWEKKRVTVITKAYPEPSAKYGDVACTAGITDEREWIRLYPIDMRHFIGKDKISKFDIIEVEVKKDKDKLERKESHKVRSDSIRIIDRNLTKPKADWEARNKIILGKLDNSVEALRDSYDEDKTSLGLIEPSILLDFIKTEELEIYEKNGWSFTLNLDGKVITKVTKIPHIFKYRFTCPGCREGEHIMQCEDWELFESYRSWGPLYGDPETLWKKIRGRFFFWMKQKRNLYFLMGMYSQYPTWFIIGIYYPPKR